MHTGFVICVGNPFDGLKLYGAADGFPFTDHDEAVEIAEKLFKADEWCVVGINSVADIVGGAGTWVECERCEEEYDEDTGEGYCGLCPECADATDSSYVCLQCAWGGCIDDFTGGYKKNAGTLTCPNCRSTDIYKDDV